MSWSEITRIVTPDGAAFVELTADHIGRVANQVKDFLRQLGVGEGDTILIVGTGDDASQLRPVAQAAMDLRCSYIASDLPRFVRPDLLEFFRQFELRAVLGLTAPIVSAIQELDVDVAELFRGSPLYCTEEALDVLETGAAPRRWAVLGHLVGAQCPAAESLHLFCGSWKIATGADGRLELASDGQKVKTGRTGRLLDSTCVCGLDAPVLQLDFLQEGVLQS